MFAGLFGLAFGSFLTVVVYRVPRGESVVRPASRCPNCQTPLAPYDNLPVISWLILRGRCRTCREPIGARYVVLELATAAVFVVAVLRLGMDGALPGFLAVMVVHTAVTAIELGGTVPLAALRAASAVSTAAFVLAAATGDEWPRLGRGLLAGAVLGVVVLTARRVSRGVTASAVELAGLTGLALGWAGAVNVLVGTAAAVVVALAMRNRRTVSIALSGGLLAGLLLP